MANDELDKLAGWNLSADFGAPTARELELELALGSDSWLSLMKADEPSAAPLPADRRAIVIRGRWTGYALLKRGLSLLRIRKGLTAEA